MRTANTCSGALLPFSNVNKNNDEFTIRSFCAIVSQLKPPKRNFFRFFSSEYYSLDVKRHHKMKIDLNN